MHVAFILPTMHGGGVERIRLYLIRKLLERGHEVDLIVALDGGEFLPLVPEGAHVRVLGKQRFRQAIPELRRYLRERQPNAMQAVLWPLTCVVLLARIDLPNPPRVVVSDHNVLSVVYSRNWRLLAWLKVSVRMLYPLADAVACVSRAIAADLSRLSGIPQDRISVISNPNPEPAVKSFPAAETDLLWQGNPGGRILTVGRLKAKKNHLLLLEAFARAARERDMVLAIVGDGDLEPRLRQRAAELGIADRVILSGFESDPSPWYASANQFVLSSDFEGFGNVLVETLHFGLPIVATDCPGGARDVLADGAYGKLVPAGDSAALASAMIEALDAQHDREAAMARAARLSIEPAVERYLALFRNGE